MTESAAADEGKAKEASGPQGDAKSENKKFFDRSEKSDVEYKAQLIAAKQAKRSKCFGLRGSLKTYSR